MLEQVLKLQEGKLVCAFCLPPRYFCTYLAEVVADVIVVT